MNYYNPYFGYPYMTATAPTSGGIFSKIFGKGINWNSLLSGTQKTLNIVNQAIPLVKQATPVMQNAKTMFRLMNEFKKVDTPISNTNSNRSNNEKKQEIETKTSTDTYSQINNGPTFFI